MTDEHVCRAPECPGEHGPEPGRDPILKWAEEELVRRATQEFPVYNRLIRQEHEDQLMALYARTPLWPFSRTPLPPPTRRQRAMSWLRGVRWSIHDRLFPECHANDDY